MATGLSAKAQTEPHRYNKPGKRHCIECDGDLAGRGVQSRRCKRCAGLRAKETDPEKLAARKLVAAALVSGKIKRGTVCHYCTATADETVIVGHHHWGYSGKNATRLRWCCNRCHMRLHHAIRFRAESDQLSRLRGEDVAKRRRGLSRMNRCVCCGRLNSDGMNEYLCVPDPGSRLGRSTEHACPRCARWARLNGFKEVRS